MAEDIEYCSITPDFPQTAYMVFLNPIRGARQLEPYPMAFIYRALDEVADVVLQAVQEIQNAAEFSIQQHALLLPLQFTELYPMRREFWQKPAHHYDSVDRMKTFQQVATTPQFYKLLVTPTYLDDNGRWHLNATLPLYHDANFRLIEQFMFNTDQSVDERAKYAALYSFGAPSRYNWETQQISEFKTKRPHVSKHHN